MNNSNTTEEKGTKSKSGNSARDKAIQKGMKDRSEKISSNSIVNK